MASTVFRSVESNRSLRFSSRETLSWVIPRVFASLTCVILRACRSSHEVIFSAIHYAARVSTFLGWAGLSFLIMSSTFAAMVPGSAYGIQLVADLHNPGHLNNMMYIP